MESDHFSQKGLCLSMSISLDPRHEDPQDDPVDLDVQHFRDLLRQKKCNVGKELDMGPPLRYVLMVGEFTQGLHIERQGNNTF